MSVYNFWGHDKDGVEHIFYVVADSIEEAEGLLTVTLVNAEKGSVTGDPESWFTDDQRIIHLIRKDIKGRDYIIKDD